MSIIRSYKTQNKTDLVTKCAVQTNQVQQKNRRNQHGGRRRREEQRTIIAAETSTELLLAERQHRTLLVLRIPAPLQRHLLLTASAHIRRVIRRYDRNIKKG